MSSESHLQMIQGVISRLSSQSTTVKGWCVTVTAALLGFGATSAKPVAVAVAAYVVVAFALLDASFLATERSYRALYRLAVVGGVPEWSLDAERPGVGDVLRALRSVQSFLLYGSSLVTSLVVGLYLAIE